MAAAFWSVADRDLRFWRSTGLRLILAMRAVRTKG